MKRPRTLDARGPMEAVLKSTLPEVGLLGWIEIARVKVFSSSFYTPLRGDSLVGNAPVYHELKAQPAPSPGLMGTACGMP